ncbi:MAG TPA: hypothetical protein VHT27_08125 [Solirubrobacteraceae bacterium]|nr:hypothetical protein [Solirubrobacteraceae bacterium]
MRQRARSESGFTMITAIITLFIITGLGIGLLQMTDQQQHAALTEQQSQTAFNIAEAAMNAQIGQLARTWPSAKAYEGAPTTYATKCTSSEAESASNDCPTKKSLAEGYPLVSSTSSCSKGGNEAWGSSKGNEWTTYVRDDGATATENPLYSSSTTKGEVPYDANGDGKVWVRSVGVYQCRVVVLLALVSEQEVTLKFPEYAVAGNWFATTNNGKKVIVNTQGKSAQAGGVSMRCEGRTKANCEEFREGQVNPDTTKQAATPSPALSATQLEALAYAAKVKGHYFGPKECPKSAAEVEGEPAYVTGPCELSFTGNSVINSLESPGFLVIGEGTLNLGGGVEYFGTVYGVNKQKSTEAVVHLQGKGRITGSILIDGTGGIEFGSSGGKGKGEENENENFVYNDEATKNLKTFAGAAGTRNSFRVLPENQ